MIKWQVVCKEVGSKTANSGEVIKEHDNMEDAVLHMNTLNLFADWRFVYSVRIVGEVGNE